MTADPTSGQQFFFNSKRAGVMTVLRRRAEGIQNSKLVLMQ